jgi:hypothetical protein
MKRHGLPGLALIAAGLLAGCSTGRPGLEAPPNCAELLTMPGGAAPPQARAQKPEKLKSNPLDIGPNDPGSQENHGARIRAVVNGDPILEEEVYAAAYQNLVRPGITEAQKAEILNAKLNELIDRELVLQDCAARLGVKGKKFLNQLETAARKEFDKQWLQPMMRANKYTDEMAFKKFLRENGMPLEVIKRQWERNFMAMEYLRHRVEPHLMRINIEQAQEYYDKHTEDYRVEDVARWQDIFIATARHNNDAAAARRFAESLRARVQQGEDFARLAQEFDNGESHLRKDAEGEGQKRGEVRPREVEPVVFALKEGGVGALVEIPTGFHIVRLLERTHAGQKPFDAKLQKEIRERLRMEIYTREMKRAVSDLKRKAIIDVAQQIK